MSWRRELAKLGALFRPPKPVDDLEEEIRSHLQIEEQENLESGMPPDEAHYAALRRFGNVALAEEKSREMWEWNWLQSSVQDVRFGLRILGKHPGFAAVAVITLALGIGASTAIFSVVNAVLLRPLYNQDPKRLISVSERFHGEGGIPVSLPDLADWRQQSRSFVWIAGFHDDDVNILGREPELVSGAQVDANLFRWFGTQPLLGRTFLPEEGQPGKDRVILLSYALWQRHFGGDPSVVGKTLTIEGKERARAGSYTVVGIMKPYFQFPPSINRVDHMDYEAWIPLSFYGKSLTDREDHSLQVVAYLQPGVSLQHAQVEMDTITRRIGQEHEKSHRELNASMVQFLEGLTGTASQDPESLRQVRLAIQVSFAAVILVLVIACTNVANLQLVRSTTRQREIAVRVALGATGGRIVGQLLSESVLLAGSGGVAGLLVAKWGTALLVAISPEGLSHSWQIGVDGHVLLFALGISLLSGVLVGLAPAVRARQVGLSQALKEGSRTLNASPQQNFIREPLLISEVALSFVLLIGAGLLIRSFRHLQKTDLGLQPDHLLTLTVYLPESKYPTPEARAALFNQGLKRIEALPGVEWVGATSDIPMIVDPGGGGITLEGRDTPSLRAAFIMVSLNYFHALGTPLRAGRNFTESDQIMPPQVGLVSEALAHRLWPKDNPLGKRLGLDLPSEKPTWIQVVGVIGDIKHYGPAKNAVEAVYLPDLRANFNNWITYVIRSSTNFYALTRAAEHEIHAIGENATFCLPQPMEWWVASLLAGRRFVTILLGIFAAIALLLAAVGIWGVISYSVVQRTQEIGIRMALGASQRSVLRLIIEHGLKLTTVGLGIGLLASLALTRIVSSFLFGVTTTDPATFVGVFAFLAVLAMLASYVPARRATKIDPMVALRYE